ncbi:transcriptional regulator [Deltaproteobacteria bacterium]|nr:transcriptional regulator [Deltaproteobacteria bacterium]
MPVSYARLWKMLIDKRLKKTDLIGLCGISSNVLARLGKGEQVSLESLEKICLSLSCNIGEIMEFISDELGEGK